MSMNESAEFMVNLDRNPVNSKKRKNHWKFLTSEDNTGLKNTSRTHREINESLRDSLLDIHHTLKFTKKLVAKKGKNKNWMPDPVGENHLNQIFNAVNLESIFYNLLKDPKYNSKQTGHVPYKYDLCTSEKARMMAEIGLSYLIQSEKFKDDRIVKDSVKKILDDFRLLTGSILNETIKDRKLDQQLEQVSTPIFKMTNKKIKELEDKSPIPIDDLNDPDLEIVLSGRDETIKELFAIQNKLKIENNPTEKKKLLKSQKQKRKFLYDIDVTSELLDEKKTLEYAQRLLWISPQNDLSDFLSNVNPLHSKTLLMESQKLIKEVLK